MFPEINFQDYKLIVFDVDGTILELGQPLDQSTLSVFRKLTEEGYLVTLATGKNFKSTQKTAQALGINLPLILSNGCVLQSVDGTILKKHLLPIDFLEILIRETDRLDYDLAVHINEEIYVKNINHNSSILFDYGTPSLESIGEWGTIEALLPQAYKCLVIDRVNRSHLYDFELRMRGLTGESVNYCQTLPEMLEFMPAGISKLSGVKFIARRYGIQLNSVMAFGDGNNDIEMLTEVGFGAAVKNATAAVKEIADWIVPACSVQGPAKFLDNLLTKI